MNTQELLVEVKKLYEQEKPDYAAVLRVVEENPTAVRNSAGGFQTLKQTIDVAKRMKGDNSRMLSQVIQGMVINSLDSLENIASRVLRSIQQTASDYAATGGAYQRQMDEHVQELKDRFKRTADPDQLRAEKQIAEIYIEAALVQAGFGEVGKRLGYVKK